MIPTEKTLFEEAISRPDPGEQAAFLDRACGESGPLRSRVNALIEAYRSGTYLEAQCLGLQAAVIDTAAFDPAPIGEEVIGRYTIKEQIGEGGMGTVYVAEQREPVRRLVALKIVKPGMDSKEVIARFEGERQALALMDHPNIARVLDGGTTEAGRPYFVMDLVRGLPVTEYCDKAKLPPEQRLKLFVQICRAVQHAHTKGIIHRDLKPSNILVTVVDGEPVPKVIDFGVAKALHANLTEKPAYTRFAQLLGTPLYMSPEQAELSGVDVDTRADIYSLGVLLYELLTGTTPFDPETFKRVGYDEMLRLIRESEPPRPSYRLTTLNVATRSTISERRGVVDRHLSKILRGELDWIVMKALEKDRSRRYESAGAFAADVERYLAGEPVEACPPSTGYRLRTFARRNRTSLLAGGLVAMALVAGTCVSIWQAVEASVARRHVEGSLQEETKARADADENYRLARAAVKRMLTRVATEEVGRIPEMGETRRKLLEDAVAFYTELLRNEPKDADAYYERGRVYRLLVKFDEAFRDFKTASELDPLHLGCQVALGRYFGGVKYDLRQALTHFSRAVELDTGDRPEEDPETCRAQLHCEMMRVHGELGNRDECRKWLKSYLELAPVSAQTSVITAEGYRALGESREALAHARRALEQDSKEPWAYFHLSLGLSELGDFKQALEAINEAIRLYPRQNDLELALLYHSRGTLYHVHLSNDEAALADFNRTIEIDSTSHWWVRKRRALILFRKGEFSKALDDIARAVDLKPYDGSIVTWITPDQIAACPDAGFRQGMIDQATRAITLTNGFPGAYASRGRLYLAMKQEAKATDDLHQAITCIRRLLDEWRGPLGPGNHGGDFDTFAWHLVAWPDPTLRNQTLAVELAKKAVELQPSKSHQYTLGVCLYRAGDWKAAVAALGKSMELGDGGNGFDWFFLAMAHWKLGEKDKAHKWFDQADQWMEKNQPNDAKLISFRAEAAELLNVNPVNTNRK